jgi:DNA topoisomerase-1
LLHEKAELARNRLIASFRDGAIQVLNGRYGPYITDGEKNAKIPKDREPKSLTEAECAELLAAAPPRPKRGGRFGNRGKGAPAKSAAATPAAEKTPARNSAAKKSTAKKTAAKRTAGKKAAKKAVAKKGPAA